MFKSNSMIQNAAKELQAAFTDKKNAEEVQMAFDNFGKAIAATVAADYESAHGDQNILIQRGFRVLTGEERQYYTDIIEASKKGQTVQTMNGLLSDKVMPNTVIEDVYKHLVEQHPLLARINFQSVAYLTRWIMNDHSVQTAAWGAVNTAVAQQITSAFQVIEMAQCKLSAYAVIEMDMLELGPQFLDGYIRTFLEEALARAIEKAIISGTGNNQPLGLDRDVSNGVSVSGGVYPQKSAVTVSDFMPASYGALLATLAETEVWYTEDSTGTVTPAATAANADGSAKSGYTKHGGNSRVFDQVTMVVNQKDYLTKIMPATTMRTAIGTYEKDLFPFPTEVLRSADVPSGYALIFLPEEYFFGIGTSKEGQLTYSDEYKFLEDQRVFKIKFHGNGRPYDNTVAVLADISSVEPAYFYVKDVATANG